MLGKAIESLEAEIAGLKDRVALEIREIYTYLSQPGAKTKLRPRIMEHRGYSTFSIIWQRLLFYDFANRKAKLKAIRKGPSYQVPRSRLFSHCLNCPAWETEYIWETELRFARVRRKISLLSQGLSALKIARNVAGTVRLRPYARCGSGRRGAAGSHQDPGGGLEESLREY